MAMREAHVGKTIEEILSAAGLSDAAGDEAGLLSPMAMTPGRISRVSERIDR